MEEAWSALKLDIERFALHLNRTAADVTDRASRPIKKNLNRSRKQKNKLKEDGRKLTESLKRGMKDSDAAKLGTFRCILYMVSTFAVFRVFRK